MQINVLKKIKGSVCCVRKEVRESLVIGYSLHSPPPHYESHYKQSLRWGLFTSLSVRDIKSI